MRKPRALRSGDRIAVVAPASPFAREAFDAGIAELRVLGFDPVFDERIFERNAYLAGSAETRASVFRQAWEDSGIAALVAARGGYGSVQILPLLDAAFCAASPKPFIGYSDNTSILSWLTWTCGVVCFHGPMIEGRFARGEAGYDRDTFTRALCRTMPIGEVSHPQVEVLQAGEASGPLTGGTITQLTASFGTPYAFDPPRGCVLFLEEVGERPYRIDRMVTQLRLSGILARASAVVFGELTRCEEAVGGPAVRDVVVDLMAGFHGPVLYGLPSGHTDGPTLTLPFGVRARVVTSGSPGIVIEAAAVVD
jgi:muramoyltetrapeptide carboxypeptidase